jgi:hypothetical protein
MQNNRRKGQARRWLATAGLAGVATMAMTAHAADPTPAPAQNGAMTFPNVIVVAMPPAEGTGQAVQATGAQGGMKAFIDPDSGQLVPPTAETAAALEAAGTTKSISGARAHPAGLNRPPKVLPPSTGGAVGMRLDDSQMSYFVARKNTDGSLGMACIPGDETAQWLSNVAGAPAKAAMGKGDLK